MTARTVPADVAVAASAPVLQNHLRGNDQRIDFFGCLVKQQFSLVKFATLHKLLAKMGRIQRKVTRLFNPSSFKTFPQDSLFASANPTHSIHLTPAEQPAVVSRGPSPFSFRSPATNESDWDEMAKPQSSGQPESSNLRTHSSDLCSTGDWLEAQESTAGIESNGRDPAVTWKNNLQETQSCALRQQPQVSAEQGICLGFTGSTFGKKESVLRISVAYARCRCSSANLSGHRQRCWTSLNVNQRPLLGCGATCSVQREESSTVFSERLPKSCSSASMDWLDFGLDVLNLLLKGVPLLTLKTRTPVSLYEALQQAVLIPQVEVHSIFGPSEIAACHRVMLALAVLMPELQTLLHC